ncbi:MAG TPA: hypothetical protein VFC87_00260 [Perlabentimonas sp.]|nr:hypothetical protein [Bacteroidales bacterium]HZJ73208.1 hypothetical protein [Perlabentimonas sp.]
MIFEKGHLYHIYNQGNNRQRIFFSRENYLFFLEKIRKHVLPYADVLAWCLMPNHFHIMVYVNEVELVLPTQGLTRNKAANSQTLSRQESQGLTIRSVNTSQPLAKRTSSGCSQRTFNSSIGIMLRSYTRAINIQEKRSGALFRQQTKANCLTCNDKITRAWFSSQGAARINIQPTEDQYPNTCFNYINLNPVKAGLVKQCEDWEFSSYPDIVRLRNGKLINRARIEEFGLVLL